MFCSLHNWHLDFFRVRGSGMPAQLATAASRFKRGRFMKKARKSLIVFLVSLLVGVTAALTVPDRSLGGSISYDVSIGGDGPDVSYGFLPQFDPSLGPLNSVTYTGSLGLQSLFFFSDVTQAVNVNYTGPVYVYLAGPGSSPLEPVIVWPVVSGTQAIVGYAA